jgi:ankyrin repeat protein
VLTAAIGLNELASVQSEDDTPERSEDGEALDAEVEAKAEMIEVQIPMRLSSAHLIAHLGLERQVSAFLERGRPMDDRDFAGLSPLVWAARGGHEAVVNLLPASHGVDAEAADKQGRTPLLWAMWFGREAVVERLLGSGRVSLESPLPAKPVLRVPVSAFRGAPQSMVCMRRTSSSPG